MGTRPQSENDNQEEIMTTTAHKPTLTRRQLEYIRLPERKMVKDLNTALKRWLIDSAGKNKAEANRKLRGKPERYQSYQNDEDGILLEYTGHLRNTHYNAWIYSARQYIEGELRIDVNAMVQEFRPNRSNNHTFTANLVAISQCTWEQEEEQVYQSQSESLYSIVDQYRHKPRRIEPNGTPLNIHDLMKGNNVIAIPWQHDNKPDPDAIAIAEEWAANMDIAIIDHSGHRSISRELTAPEHILGWNDAKAAVLTKYGNPEAPIQVIPVPVEEMETAREVISRHGDKDKDHIAFTTTLEAIHGMVSSIPESELTLQDIQESFSHPTGCRHEQRVFVLEDQLKEAQAKIAQHENTIESLNEQREIAVEPDESDVQESENGTRNQKPNPSRHHHRTRRKPLPQPDLHGQRTGQRKHIQHIVQRGQGHPPSAGITATTGQRPRQYSQQEGRKLAELFQQPDWMEIPGPRLRSHHGPIRQIPSVHPQRQTAHHQPSPDLHIQNLRTADLFRQRRRRQGTSNRLRWPPLALRLPMTEIRLSDRPEKSP